ncbi:hypothetical protein EVAR_99785_1 [Eumeta japonica]|uniref:Uncharacterized protein n=1 Tax=Eumeta variegata TaxID=151549 RepID=A0A4C2A5U0_EUMVA|nr:hypothetical protein EVAR_99785_1 [Eumeta japonica]
MDINALDGLKKGYDMARAHQVRAAREKLTLAKKMASKKLQDKIGNRLLGIYFDDFPSDVCTSVRMWEGNADVLGGGGDKSSKRRRVTAAGRLI